MGKIVKKDKLILIVSVISIVIIGYGLFRIMASIIIDNKGIGIKLPKDSIIIIKEDNHGGFHGDGEYFSEIQLTNEGLKEFTSSANKTGQWNSLPLSKDIEIILHGWNYKDPGYHTGNKAENIPKDIKSGIYYVKDRFTKEDPNMKSKNILSRNSYNVTISILNFETKKLYIYELDT